MKRIGDGSVTPSYFGLKTFDPVKEIKDRGMTLVEGQVHKTYFTDDANNRSKTRVEYDVIYRRADGTSSTAKNAIYLGDIQGTNDYSETILEQNAFAFKETLSKENKPANMNGTRVILAFLDGNIEKPIIVAGLSHERRRGAKIEDGIRKKGEFRGIEWEINKDGELLLTYKSPAKPGGERVRPETAPTSFKIDIKGNITLLQEEASEEEPVKINEVIYDRELQKKTETIGKENSIVEEKDGQAEKVTLTFKSGLTLTVDGAGDKVDIVTSGGAAFKIDGAAGTVALGTPSTELLQQISDQLDKLITWANSVGAIHTHIGNLGYSTAPPDQAADYTQLGTDLSDIKALVDGIKGSI